MNTLHIILAGLGIVALVLFIYATLCSIARLSDEMVDFIMRDHHDRWPGE